MPKFTKGRSGNPKGRPKGTRNKATLIRARLERHEGEIVRALVKQAKGGDVQAIRLILERICPALRPVDHGEVKAEGDGADLAQALVRAAVDGQIPVRAARDLAAALHSEARIRQIADLEQRLEALERKHEKPTSQIGTGGPRWGL